MRVARPGEQEPARVPETAMQAGEAADKGKRAMKRPIWTARMLEALERGVKGGLCHQRWPNQFFHDAGLFCLELAKRRELQSLTGTH
jgi:hypothetical protein